MVASLDDHFSKKYAHFHTSLFSSDVSSRTVSLADLIADSEDEHAVPSKIATSWKTRRIRL